LGRCPGLNRPSSGRRFSAATAERGRRNIRVEASSLRLDASHRAENRTARVRCDRLKVVPRVRPERRNRATRHPRTRVDATQDSGRAAQVQSLVASIVEGVLGARAPLVDRETKCQLRPPHIRESDAPDRRRIRVGDETGRRGRVSCPGGGRDGRRV